MTSSLSLDCALKLALFLPSSGRFRSDSTSLSSGLVRSVPSFLGVFMKRLKRQRKHAMKSVPMVNRQSRVNGTITATNGLTVCLSPMKEKYKCATVVNVIVPPCKHTDFQYY